MEVSYKKSRAAENQDKAKLNTSIKLVSTEIMKPLIIMPSKGWRAINIRDLWEYRELLYLLVWRDIKVRYKQTVLGVGWAIFQPFPTMVVFSIFFG